MSAFRLHFAYRQFIRNLSVLPEVIILPPPIKLDVLEPPEGLKREPHLYQGIAAVPAPPRFRRAMLSEWRKQSERITWTFVIISLLIHAALIALIAFFAGRLAPPPPTIIPMHLVMEEPDKKSPTAPPPPPPPPPPQQSPPPPPPPPRGPLASDELGDPDATEKDPTATRAPASGQSQRKAGEAPPPPTTTTATKNPTDVARPEDTQDPEKTASVKQADIPETTSKLALGGALAPPKTNSPIQKPDAETAKEVPKPSQVHLRTEIGGSKKPTERPEEPDHGGGHKAKYPGPDANRDEYLSYIRDLTNDQLARIPPQFYTNRTGIAGFDVLIRPNGTIIWFSQLQSSGFPDTDRALLAALNGISGFPPLPAELREPDEKPTRLSFTLPIAAIGKSR